MLRLLVHVVQDHLQICFFEAVQSYHSNTLAAITCMMQGTIDMEVPVNLCAIFEDLKAVTGADAPGKKGRGLLVSSGLLKDALLSLSQAQPL